MESRTTPGAAGIRGMSREIPMARLEDLGCVHAEHKLAISIEAQSRHSADAFTPRVHHAKLC